MDEEAFANNLKNVRRVLGMTQQEVADMLGRTPQAVSRWERAKGIPSVQTAIDIARKLKIPVGALLDSDGVRKHLSITGEPIVRNSVYSSDDFFAPLYGRIAAGTPIEMLPVEDRIWANPDVRREHPRGFYLEVKGESMNKVLANGCYAFVDPDADHIDGDVMAVVVNGSDATIKRVFQGADSIVLAPDSYDPRFEEQRIAQPSPVEVVLIGRVVWSMAPYRDRL